MKTEAENTINWLDLKWFEWETLTGFEYANLYMFWLLAAIPLFVLIRWLLVLIYRQKMGVATFSGKLQWSWTVILKFIPDLVLTIFWCLLVVALARPQRSDELVDRWSEGIDITLLLDVSNSMRLQDFKPNRLEAAKKVASEFIGGRTMDQIGMVVFAGEAFSLCPLTTDYDLMKSLIKDNVKLGMMKDQSTAIGSALSVGVDHMSKSNSKSKVMILLSDGENTGGKVNPITAAELAYGYGIKIYVIGIGRDGKIQDGTNFFGYPNYVMSNLDETSLRKIAKIGKGAYFRASNKKALKEIFKKIDEFEKTEFKENRYKNIRDYYQVYIYWGLCFFLLWLLLKSTFISNWIED